MFEKSPRDGGRKDQSKKILVYDQYKIEKRNREKANE